MKDNILYLYRHGNTFNSGDKVVQVGLRSDLALTEAGEQQALQFAEFLKKSHITPQALYCGDLQRQSRSLKILQPYFPDAMPYHHTQALNEIDYGLWEGKTAEEINASWPNEANSWHEKALWPTGIFEQNQDYHLNLISSLLQKLNSQINQGSPSPNILISSNGIIRYFLYFSSLWPQITSNGNMLEYKVKTGHFCKVALKSSNQIEVIEWNQNPAKI